MTDPRFVAWAIGRGLNPNFINDGTGIRCSDERAWFAYLAWEESSRQNEAVLIQNQAEIERLKAQMEQIDTVRSGLPCDHVWGTSGYSPALDAPVAAVCMKCGTSGESARNGWMGCNPKPEPIACNHVWNSGYGGERNGSFTDAVAVCVKCGQFST